MIGAALLTTDGWLLDWLVVARQGDGMNRAVGRLPVSGTGCHDALAVIGRSPPVRGSGYDSSHNPLYTLTKNGWPLPLSLSFILCQCI